jgi:hypothetical protein
VINNKVQDEVQPPIGITTPRLGALAMENIGAALEDSISKIFGDGELPAEAVYQANLPGTHVVVLFILAVVAATALR